MATVDFADGGGVDRTNGIGTGAHALTVKQLNTPSAIAARTRPTLVPRVDE